METNLVNNKYLNRGRGKLTTEEFIRRAKIKHGNTYDYSKTVYHGKFKKLKIFCKIHGEFEQEAWGHIKGKGCIDCSGFKPLTTETFIKKSKLVYGDKYDYSKVNFISVKKPVIIICSIHNEFIQKPYGHLTGRGCKKCAGFDTTKEEFLKLALQIHGEKYDYSLMNYDIKVQTIDLICPIHGNFTISRRSHINVNIKKGCPYCSESKGEKEVRVWLYNNNIKFIAEKRFKNCINKKTQYQLPFDFYLPDYNICIEYDGQQHSIACDFFGGDDGLKYRQKLDKIKNEYCLNNNIKLIRIKHTENVEKKLNENIIV